MKDLIKTILYDWQEQKLPEINEREINLADYLNLKVSKIITLTGFRRVGKSYLLLNLIKKLLQNKTKEDIIYINFEDERIPNKTEFLSELLPAIKETFGKTPEFLFLDEIQNIPNWSKWLRRIYDTENIKIFVTGSSSKMSSQEIPTELRGRCLEVKVFPLSFKEFLKFKNFEIDAMKIDFQEEKKAKLLYLFEEYLFYGGMPEVVLSDSAQKKNILQQYYSTVLRRDVIERFNIKNEEALKAMLQLLLNSTFFSISQLHSTLKSANLKIGKTTLSQYISYLENSYFLNLIPIFSYKIKDQLQYQRKISIIDNGFIEALSLKFSKNYGRFFENLAHIELKRRNKGTIFYWRDAKHREVDIALKQDLEIKSLIQVCYDLTSLGTKKRETDSLIKAGNELNCENLFILTNNYNAEEVIQKKKIQYVPFWKWLIE
ncbi:MAG: ATP-binding protein [bacterium]